MKPSCKNTVNQIQQTKVCLVTRKCDGKGIREWDFPVPLFGC